MKMKKKILSAAVLAALGAGSAQAVNLSTDGTGEVLVFPYFTVQGNEETLLSIVNTTNEGKVVKVRFREAYNTQEVLDFHVYLSPYDVWVAKIQDDPAGGAQVTTPDNSCTTMDTNPQPFVDLLFGDTGPTGIERTREGYFTAIEIARIVNMDLDGNGAQDYVHDASGVPDNCGAIRTAWLNGTMAANATVDQPTGGLMGTLGIINVQSGTEVTVPATVLENFLDTPQHVAPGSLRPDWQDANPNSVVMTSDSSNGSVSVYADAWATGEDAVSAVLMASALMNEYTVNPATEASTAWIVTFPTKTLYVNGGAARAPFTHTFAGDTDGDGVACEEIGVSLWNREEQQREVTGSLVSPPPPSQTLSLCYEANVIQFGDSSNVFSAENTVTRFNDSALPGNTGWGKISFTAAAHTMTSLNGTVYNGLPVIGFKATVLGNSNVGVGASYAAAVNHAYERSIVGQPAFTVGSGNNGNP
ncbi:conserved hypothetical protein [Thiolapillus brandeum]|uniref:Cell surface protein n=2 Tax=Thiolapillus brandeum TaxID=1076588 RepID=A0A7U6GGW5_9GAMM|nr:conserved hypothetical protein [Thiolapillus brandeum]